MTSLSSQTSVLDWGKKIQRRVLGDSVVRRLKARRVRVASALGVRRYARPGWRGLDTRLIAHVAAKGGSGTFIELGANDGVQQSNTYALEREFGWRGVLIEPVPELAAECRRNRPMAEVICAAAGNGGGPGFTRVAYADLKSAVSTSGIAVATTSLEQVIEQLMSGRAPDLLVVDVEGHELEVLRGLGPHRPTWVLVETDDADRVANALTGYSQVGALSHHDYLFSDTEPRR
jgi:FkbM family methyltransferase